VRGRRAVVPSKRMRDGPVIGEGWRSCLLMSERVGDLGGFVFGSWIGRGI
jgi:hypothetical protein